MTIIQSKVFACFMGFAVLSIFNVNNSFALEKGGVFVEPMITYERGTGHIAADGRYSIPKLKDSSLKQDIKTKSFNYGPTLGLQMPWIVGLRAWGGYILGRELDTDADKGINEKFKIGNGWCIGAGPKLGITSLNAEYQDIEYDETDIQEVGIFTAGYIANNVKLRNKSLVLSLSFPMSI